jgi:hypothetical protein
MSSKFFNNPQQTKVVKDDKKVKTAQPKPVKTVQTRKTGRGK